MKLNMLMDFKMPDFCSEIYSSFFYPIPQNFAKFLNVTTLYFWLCDSTCDDADNHSAVCCQKYLPVVVPPFYGTSSSGSMIHPPYQLCKLSCVLESRNI